MLAAEAVSVYDPMQLAQSGSRQVHIMSLQGGRRQVWPSLGSSDTQLLRAKANTCQTNAKQHDFTKSILTARVSAKTA